MVTVLGCEQDDEQWEMLSCNACAGWAALSNKFQILTGNQGMSTLFQGKSCNIEQHAT